MDRQPEVRRRPQRTATCSECGKTFQDNRTPEKALLEAIFSELLCPKCRQKKDTITCTACNEPIKKGREIYCEGLPYHHYDLPTTKTDIPTYCIVCRRLNGQHDEGCPNQ